MTTANSGLYETLKAKISPCWLDVVDDGGPPVDTIVLAVCELGIGRNVWPARLDRYGRWYSSYSEGNSQQIVNVTHWMPMPDPPPAFRSRQNR